MVQKERYSVSLTPPFKCKECGNGHEKQAFISHASKDIEIANKVKKACCQAGVKPYLFEFSPDALARTAPSDSIALNVAASENIYVLLSDSVSQAYWTQAWIGYELGISKGFTMATNKITNVIVVQDIRQGLCVSIPQLDVLFLFDFDLNTGWNQYQGLIQVSNRANPHRDFYKKANRFRMATLATKVKCENCKSEYEAWIDMADALKLGKRLNLISMRPEFRAECTVDCPSCDKIVTRNFKPMLPGYIPNEYLSDGPNRVDLISSHHEIGSDVQQPTQ